MSATGQMPSIATMQTAAAWKKRCYTVRSQSVVSVAQPVEHRSVEPRVAGSNPVAHPKLPQPLALALLNRPFSCSSFRIGNQGDCGLTFRLPRSVRVDVRCCADITVSFVSFVLTSPCPPLPSEDGRTQIPEKLSFYLSFVRGNTSQTMTPCAHDARYFAGLEQFTTSQMPSLTGSI
jgi:hypothetical protein